MAETQYRDGIWLLIRHSGHPGITSAIHFLELSAQNGGPDGQFTIAYRQRIPVDRFLPSILALQFEITSDAATALPQAPFALTGAFRPKAAFPQI
jgi:hypothetical protein